MKRFLKWLLALCVIAGIAVIVARFAYPLPDISERPASEAMAADPGTPLGGLMATGMAKHPGKSGVISLHSGHDALASRLALAAQAQRSLDVQYYIWHDDTAGILLLDALYQASRRGVRVRLLLDDNGVPGLDSYMAALNGEPDFEIRLFNPSTVRQPKTLGYTFDFFRMNRRMHNKSFTRRRGHHHHRRAQYRQRIFPRGRRCVLRRYGRAGHRGSGARYGGGLRPILEQRIRLCGRDDHRRPR